MKLSILAITLTILSQSSYAESYSFSCGKVGNVPRTLVAKTKAPGQDGYVLGATYQTGGVDQTTGMQTKKTYQLVGQSDILENNGKQSAALTFLLWSDPNFQVVVTKTKKKGDVVDGAQIDAKNGTGIDFKCTLNSYTK